MRSCRLFLYFLVFSLSSSPAQAEEVALESVVTTFLLEQVSHTGDEVSVEVLDSGLTLPSCPQPAPFLPYAENQSMPGRVTVGLRCDGPDSPARYLNAEVEVIGEYLQLNTAMQRGERVTANMLDSIRGPLSRLPRGTLRNGSAIIGQAATRNLARGSLVQARNFRPLPLVERGQEVTVQSRGKGFTITRKGKALETGGLGENIRVQLSRRESLSATVSGPNSVDVD